MQTDQEDRTTLWTETEIMSTDRELETGMVGRVAELPIHSEAIQLPTPDRINMTDKDNPMNIAIVILEESTTSTILLNAEEINITIIQIDRPITNQQEMEIDTTTTMMSTRIIYPSPCDHNTLIMNLTSKIMTNWTSKSLLNLKIPSEETGTTSPT